MSTENIVDNNNLPTTNIIAEVLTEYSLDVMKHVRFGLGSICYDKMRHIMRLQKIHCNPSCYISEDIQEDIRMGLIRSAIRDIKEL